MESMLNSSSLPNLPIKVIADKIVSNVGRVTQTFEGDPKRKVVVFEEMHASQAGQVEIALMLNRLYETYRLRNIGLEGAFFTEKILDTSWYQFLPPFRARGVIRQREDVIVQLLENGEISSSEMMALVYEDIQVAGIEDPQEYSYQLTSEADIAALVYLYKIALERMTLEELEIVSNLAGIDRIKYAMDRDDWTHAKYALTQDKTHILSIERWLQIIDEIEEVALKVKAKITTNDQANLRVLRKFHQEASRRSQTMVSNTLELLKSSPNGLVAMIIGAAHTERVAKLLCDAKVSFVVIQNTSLVNHEDNSNLSARAYKRKASSPPLSIDAPGMLGSFLDNRTKKPQTVISTRWFQTKYEIIILTAHLAHRAAVGITTLSQEELSHLPKLERVAIDVNSFKKEKNEAIFKLKVLDQNDKSIILWVRTAVDKEIVLPLLEERLMYSYNRMSVVHESEAVIAERKRMAIAADTVALFSQNQEDIMSSLLSGA